MQPLPSPLPPSLPIYASRFSEFTLLDLINEHPRECQVVWPISVDEHTFTCWADFALSAHIQVSCDRRKLISALSQPLVITRQETQLHQLALRFWDSFSFHSTEARNSTVILRHVDYKPAEAEANPQAGDQIAHWPWQRTLAFLVFCVYSTKRFTNLISGNTDDFKQMSPKLSGVALSILDFVRVNQLKHQPFIPFGKKTQFYRQRLSSELFSWYDLEYRLQSGLEAKSVLLGRPAKQEKLAFALLALNVLHHYSKPKQRNLPLNDSAHLGLLRLLLDVRHSGARADETVDQVPWMQGELLKKLCEKQPQLRLELETLYLFAKSINKLLQCGDSALPWIPEPSRHRDLIEHIPAVVALLPVFSAYPNMVQLWFAGKQLPQLLLHCFRMPHLTLIKDKLVATWDFATLKRLEWILRSDKTICILDNHLAILVRKFFEQFVELVSGRRDEWFIEDIFDPETQRPVVLFVMPTITLRRIQALCSCAQMHLTEILSLDVADFWVHQRKGAMLIAILRLVLLREPLYSVVTDVQRMEQHFEVVEKLFATLLKPGNPDFQFGLDRRLQGLERVLAFLVEQSLDVQALMLNLLLLPFAERVYVTKPNAQYLRNMLLYSLNSESNSPLILSAREHNKQYVLRLGIRPQLLFEESNARELDELDMKSPGQTARSLPAACNFASLQIMLGYLSNAKDVGTATALATMCCPIPRLRVSQKTFAKVFVSSVYQRQKDPFHEMLNFVIPRVQSPNNELYLPPFRHNGEVISPVYTSVLEAQPARDPGTWILSALETNKRKRSRSPEPLDLNAWKPITSDDETTTPCSSSDLLTGTNKTFDDFREVFGAN